MPTEIPTSMLSFEILLNTAAMSLVLGTVGGALGLGLHEGVHMLRTRRVAPRPEPVLEPELPPNFIRFHRVPKAAVPASQPTSVAS